MIEIVLFCLALIWVIFASLEDLKKREVEDWLSYSLIIFALGFRFFYSLFYDDYSVIYSGLIGLGIFFVLGNLLYYARAFAGADAKLMIAFGTILPLSSSLSVNLKMFLVFLFLFLLIGGIYGVCWSIFLSIKNYKLFKKEFSLSLSKNKFILFFLGSSGVILIILGFVNLFFALLGLMFLFFPLLFFYAKAVDSSCMIRKVSVEKLTVGDWLVNDVKIGKKLIKANWDGLSKEDIALLKKNKKLVTIRYGIPFIPVFLISLVVYLISWELGAWS